MGFRLVSLPQIIAICANRRIPPPDPCKYTRLREAGYSEISLSLIYGSLGALSAFLMIGSLLISNLFLILTLLRFIYSSEQKLYILILSLIASLGVLFFLHQFGGIFLLVFLIVIPSLIFLWFCVHVIYFKKKSLINFKYFAIFFSIFVILFCLRTFQEIYYPSFKECEHYYICKPEELPF